MESNNRAFFSDMSESFVSPAEPKANEIVKIRFRTAHMGVDQVFIIIDGVQHLMSKVDCNEYFDFYQISYQLEDKAISYYFEPVIGDTKLRFDTRGLVNHMDSYYEFRLLPGFQTPEWAKGAVMYQIYVDRFYNGDPTNDVLTREYSYIGDYSIGVENWEKNPAPMGVREFYGGDLQGVLDKMDYLEELGIDAIYFNPLFVSPSNHRYDTQDYDYIDPHIGKILVDEGDVLAEGCFENRLASKYISRVTSKENLEASNELFARLVEEAHRRGIRVIMDGVFNHCGSFNKWLDRERIYEHAKGYEKGAYVSEDSPYNDYFRFHNLTKWPYNPSYDGWWGHDTLPKLNYEGSKCLEEYVLNIAKKWVSPPYNADGWRLDVAADLGHSEAYNHEFWKKFRAAVKEANPEAIILAEHYGEPRPWLSGDEWDTIMNYDGFMEPITWFLTGMQKHSDEKNMGMYGNADAFWGAMYHATMTMPSSYVAMNELSNHDHSRFLTRTNGRVGRLHSHGEQAANEHVNKAVLREAVVIQMTWPGAPTIYYGDEAGLCGFTDPDNRRTYPWGKEDIELIQFHRDIIRIHKKCQELKTGALKELERGFNLISYGRFDDKATSVVIVNNNDHEINQSVSVWEVGVPKAAEMKRLMLTCQQHYSVGVVKQVVKNGKVQVTLPAKSAMILRYVKPVIS